MAFYSQHRRCSLKRGEDTRKCRKNKKEEEITEELVSEEEEEEEEEEKGEEEKEELEEGERLCSYFDSPNLALILFD